MQVSIAARHGYLSEASQDKLKEKVEKIGRYFDRRMSIEVVVELKNEHIPEVEIMVSAEHKHNFVAHDKADKLFTAVDSAVQKIGQQLRKYKEKVQKRHRKAEQRRQDYTEDLPIEG